LLAQDFDPCATGCRLDLARLQHAGARVAEALEAGAYLLIVNRFGKRSATARVSATCSNAHSAPVFLS
jgi:hypothetical protein